MRTKNILTGIENHYRQQGGLISVLQEIQSTYRYLPEKALRLVARETGRSLVDIYSVACFYKSFSLKPKGKHIVSVCAGTACHVRGSARILRTLESLLGIRAGGTSPDMEFTLEEIRCFGSCSLAPVMVVNQDTYGRLTSENALQILERR